MMRRSLQVVSMRFGHFLYHTNLDPERDTQAIDEALAEARLAEELGYDAVWFSEHHFTGEVAYGDPLIFATAVAMQTKRVLLGFAVVEMGLHHPVRLAIQTALLDNLSKGRVLVGVARGSSFNAFEYRGFGTSAKEAREQIEEAEWKMSFLPCPEPFNIGRNREIGGGLWCGHDLNSLQRDIFCMLS